MGCTSSPEIRRNSTACCIQADDLKREACAVNLQLLKIARSCNRLQAYKRLTLNNPVAFTHEQLRDDASLQMVDDLVAVGAENSALVDRVGTTGFVQLKAESFKTLTLREQTLAYWLTQASIAIDPINYDQNSVWGPRQKALLTEILRHSRGVNAQALGKITDFAKLFWANRGNHNEMTAQKFLPAFPFEELKAAAEQAVRNGGFKGAKPGALEKELEELRPSLFDGNFEPTITAKSPRGNRDILEASANNFYQGVSLADLKGFQEKYPLNSRLVKDGSGKPVEEVYRSRPS